MAFCLPAPPAGSWLRTGADESGRLWIRWRIPAGRWCWPDDLLLGLFACGWVGVGIVVGSGVLIDGLRVLHGLPATDPGRAIGLLIWLGGLVAIGCGLWDRLHRPRPERLVFEPDLLIYVAHERIRPAGQAKTAVELDGSVQEMPREAIVGLRLDRDGGRERLIIRGSNFE